MTRNYSADSYCGVVTYLPYVDMKGRHASQQATPRRTLADASSGWQPRRGDLAHDTESNRTGVVVAIPEDTGGSLYHLRPDGGDEWAARCDNLRPHPVTGEGRLLLNEAVTPPGQPLEEPEVLR